jgi:hypothetical protein
MHMGTLSGNTKSNFEDNEALFEPTAFELSMVKSEERMRRMLSSPFIESLERHEAMMNSILKSPALEVIERQQRILDSLPSIEKAHAVEAHIAQLECMPSQSLIESVIRSTQDIPMYSFAESVCKSLESCIPQYVGLSEGLAKTMGAALSQFEMPKYAIMDVDNRIPKLSATIVTAAEQASRLVVGMTDSFLKGLSAIENVFRNFDFSPLLEVNDNLSYFADFEAKNDVLTSFGWYMIAELPDEVVDDIYQRRNEITQEEVDAIIVQHFRDNRCQRLKSIVKSWKHLPYFKVRQIVFHEAQVCHSRRSFNASTTLISLQFEGVVTDFVRDRIMAPTFKKWAEKALLCITDLTNDLTMAAMPFEDWIVCSYVLECIDEVFSTNFSPADPDGCPNTSRHKIAHGHATEKETEANSLRRFLFMNELYKLFCCLEHEYQLAS